MRALLAAVGALTFTTATSAQVKADPDHVYGADPGWETFRQIAEAGVTERLIDPESARITWSSGYVKGVFRAFLSRRVHGYVACGRVNARNRMGGYTGATTFVAVVDFGRALVIEMDNRDGGMNTKFCEKQIADGALPPAPSATAAAVPATASESANGVAATTVIPAGLVVRAMPEGAYVSKVKANSPAAAAGLNPGMVITSVNGIPLAGMGDAMTKVLAAAGTSATLTIIGGKTITLGAPR